MDASQVNVIVPDAHGGVTVCGLDELLDHLDDGDTIVEVLENVGFDSTITDGEAIKLIPKVRQLNVDNDAKKYWGI